MRGLSRVAAIVVVLGLGPAASPAGSATLVIINNDGPGEGFNDTRVPDVAMGCPVGMNLGECRLNAFTAAAGRWAELLDSPVEIRVSAQFNPLTCDATGAVLGSAGSSTIFRDFPGAPFAGTWYHSALADALSGSDLNPSGADITAQFNSALDDDPACTLDWWYGVDGSVPPGLPNASNFYVVLLHEMAHGLGFQNFVNEATGALNGGFPDIFTRFTLDVTTGLHWNEMATNAARIASAVNTGNVVLDGAHNTAAANAFLTANNASVTLSAGAAAGAKPAIGASFGGSWTAAHGLTGDMELVNDGAGVSATDACEPLVGFTPGRIAFVDRGSCEFGLKALNAENAGATGVVVANNTGGTALFGMAPGAVGRQVTIPTMGISQNDGNAVRPTLPVSTTFAVVDVRGLHGGNGFAVLYAPNPVELGSSISHYDVSAGPNALMEPFINEDLSRATDVDMTLGLYRDEGWTIIPPSVIFEDGFETGTTLAWSAAAP